MTINIKGYHATLEVFINGNKLEISKSQEVRNHSSDFNWGYCGSGPSQLSLAILLEFIPASKASSLYQIFKNEVISLLPQDNFNIDLDMAEWLKSQGEEL